MRIQDVEVGELLTETEYTRIYSGKKDDGESVIFKIAKTFDENWALSEEINQFCNFERKVELLKDFNQTSYSPNPYKFLFVKLESFKKELSQYDRLVAIYSTRGIKLENLVALPKLYEKVEIDLQTSSWILGRILKWFFFQEITYHEEIKNGETKEYACYDIKSDTKYPKWDPESFLICAEEHRLMYYSSPLDYDKAGENIESHDEKPTYYVPKLIKPIIKYIRDWTVIEKPTKKEQQFLKVFDTISKAKSFYHAYVDYYTAVRETWSISIYPFTYRSRGSTTWEQKESEIPQL